MKTIGRCVFVIVILAILPIVVVAHCDSMNGPVVTAARKALDAGTVNLILIWVPPKDESEIKAAFQRTMAVRQLNPAAKELADMYFFETLVRIHRAGEGVAYTGLKPAETPVEPGIQEADKALGANSVDRLVASLSGAVRKTLQDRFAEVSSRRAFATDDVTAGRQYVAAYVQFIHYVERLHQAVTSSTSDHSAQPLEEHHH